MTVKNYNIDCDACGKSFDPHNEPNDYIHEHWVCGNCIADNSDEELAEILDINKGEDQ